jgi:DNA replication protein DnaC
VRTEEEVESFRSEAAMIVSNCKKCDGSLTNDHCDCVRRYHFEIEAYEACIPRDFWYYKTSEVTVNKSTFKKYVKEYVKKLNVAHRSGYGLLFSGSNGVGKTTFLSYIASNAIRKGKSSYYTTMPQLDHDLKLGWDDRASRDRMEVMFTSDFLVIDELNKEFKKEVDKPNWINTQLERILKKRYDENKPVLMATNATVRELKEIYGPTISSLISGKYKVIPMTPGDNRPKLAKKMESDMGIFDE